MNTKYIISFFKYRFFCTTLLVCFCALPTSANDRLNTDDCKTFTLNNNGIVETMKIPNSLNPYQKEGNHVYGTYQPFLDTGINNVDSISNINYILRFSINPPISSLVKNQYSYVWMLIDIPWILSGSSRTVPESTGSSLDSFCKPYETGFCPKRIAGYQYYAFPPGRYVSNAIELTQGIYSGRAVSGPSSKNLIGSFYTSNFILSTMPKPIIIEILRKATYGDRHPSFAIQLVYREYLLTSLNKLLTDCNKGGM